MNQQMKGINHQLADPNEPPEEPRPAATVLLVRDKEPEGLEVFLIERASKTNFGGAFVFPGGKVDLEDGSEEMEKICGISAEVIDARFVNPLNYAKIVESVKKTGKILLASDACERGSFLHTLASNISQLVFDYLDGPVSVVGSRNWITPAAELEESFFPQKDWIIDTIHERILPIPGHKVTTLQTTEEILRRNRLGI